MFKGVKHNNIYSFTSLDRYLYLNIINYCNLFIGNSSSGIYEAPLFKKITLNLGNRQKGRECGNSIIHLDYNKNNLLVYINNILNKKYIIENFIYPYEIINSSKLILDILHLKQI